MYTPLRFYGVKLSLNAPESVAYTLFQKKKNGHSSCIHLTAAAAVAKAKFFQPC